MLHNKPHPHPDSAEHADAGSTDWTPKNGNPCHQQIQWPSMVHPVLVERTDDDRAKHTTEHVSGMQQPQSCMLQLDSRTGMRAGPGGTQLLARSAWSLELLPHSKASLSLEEYTSPAKCTGAAYTQGQLHGGSVAGRVQSLRRSVLHVSTGDGVGAADRHQQVRQTMPAKCASWSQRIQHSSSSNVQLEPDAGDGEQPLGRTCSMERPQISNVQHSSANLKQTLTVAVSAQAQQHGMSSASSLQSVRHSKVPLESVGPLRQQQTSSGCLAQKLPSSMTKEAWTAVDCVTSCHSQDMTKNSMLAASASDECQLALVARLSTGCPHSRACDNHQPHNSDSTDCSTAGGMGCQEQNCACNPQRLQPSRVQLATCSSNECTAAGRVQSSSDASCAPSQKHFTIPIGSPTGQAASGAEEQSRSARSACGMELPQQGSARPILAERTGLDDSPWSQRSDSASHTQTAQHKSVQLSRPVFTGMLMAAGSADCKLNNRANTATTAGAEDMGDLQVNSIVPLRSAQDMSEGNTQSLYHNKALHNTDCGAHSHGPGEVERLQHGDNHPTAQDVLSLARDWSQCSTKMTLGSVLPFAKVYTKDSLVTLEAELLNPDTYKGLCGRAMVDKAIPQSKLEQPSGGSPPAQPVAPETDSPYVSDVASGASDNDLAEATRASLSDSDSSSQEDVPAQQAKPHMPTQRTAALKDKRLKLAERPVWGQRNKARLAKAAQQRQATGSEEAKRSTTPGRQGLSHSPSGDGQQRKHGRQGSQSQQRKHWQGKAAPGPALVQAKCLEVSIRPQVTSTPGLIPAWTSATRAGPDRKRLTATNKKA